MARIDPRGLLRSGVLEGTGVLLAGPPETSGTLGEGVEAGCRELGARVTRCGLLPGPRGEALEASAHQAVETAVAEIERVDLVVLDAGGLFAVRPGEGGARGTLVGCLEVVWALTRAAFSLAFLPGASGGRLLYLAPPPGAEHAEAAAAAVENLCRTLSIEWARHQVTAVTIAPGPDTDPTEIAALVAYLASPAGAYFSGCLLDLRRADGPAHGPAGGAKSSA